MSTKLACLLFAATAFGQTFSGGVSFTGGSGISTTTPIPSAGMMGLYTPQQLLGNSNATQFTTWTDGSGNGFNLTGHAFYGNVIHNYPYVWLAQNAYPTYSGPQNSFGGPCTGGTMCTLTNASMTASDRNWGLCAGFYVGNSENNGGNGLGLWYTGTDGTGSQDPVLFPTAGNNISAFWRVAATQGPTVIAPANSTIGTWRHSGPVGMCLSFSGSATTVYYNRGRKNATAAAPNRSWAAFSLLSSNWGCTTCNISYLELVPYSAAPTSSQVDQYFHHLQDAYGVPYGIIGSGAATSSSVRNKVICGPSDSNPAGEFEWGATDMCDYLAETPMVPAFYTFTEFNNISIGASKSDASGSGWDTGGGYNAYINPPYEAGLTWNIYLLILGNNDCDSATDSGTAASIAASVETHLQSIGTQIKGYGSNVKVIVGSPTPRGTPPTPSGFPNACDTNVQTWIAGLTYPNSSFDDHVDLSNSSLPFTSANYNTGDNKHWTNDGAKAVAALFLPKIQQWAK